MTEQTLRQIDKIRALLASAIEAGTIRALDRDTVTAALRDIYDEVLSMPEGNLSTCETDEPAAEPVDEPGDDRAVEPTEAPARERDNGLAEVTVPWAAMPPEAPEKTCPAEASEEAMRAERMEPEQPATEGEESIAEPEESRSEEPEDTEEPQSEELEKPHAEEPHTEEPEVPEADEPEPDDEPVMIVEAEEVAEDAPRDPDPVEEITMSAEPILPEPTRLERMLSDDRSLAARLGKERLEAVADELCHGDTETCLDMMEALEDTGDFDMAVLYIQEHYPQKSDSRAIDMLVEVLSAKFI